MGDPTLKAQVEAEAKSALKSGDKLRLSTLRMLLAAIKNKEVEGARARELSDDEIREVAQKEMKKRGDSIEAFEAAGRAELAAKERAEAEVLAAYAPEQLSDAEVDALVEEALAATGATSVREMGKVMGFVMGKAKGRVDGAVVQSKVRARLGEERGPDT
ncbi:MAG TPA: GatB/YqeY domain-containing protein [Actinomycetota bacterium]|nr:GatB/YqeY domain-containing protein [Actinomycetota bacterium]